MYLIDFILALSANLVVVIYQQNGYVQNSLT
jgi:hypothetical protein